MNIELHHCLPLSARITKKQCEINRQSGHITCSTCPVVGDEVIETVNVKEGIVGHPGFCGCGKIKWRLGMCKKCYKAKHGSDKYPPDELAVPEMKPQEVEVILEGGQGKPLEYNEIEELDQLCKSEPENIPSGLDFLLPISTDEGPPGVFLDFTGKVEVMHQLQENGVTPEQIVDLLVLISGGEYEMRRRG